MVQEETKKNTKCVLSPVFSSPDQERLFAECAKRAMSTDSRLSWDNKEISEKMPGENRLISPFANEEQEELFAQCSKDSRSTEAKLKW